LLAPAPGLPRAGGLARPGGALLPVLLALLLPMLLPVPGRVAELAEDLAELVVDGLEDRRLLGEVKLGERGEPLDGRVHPRITGASESRPHSFGIHGGSPSAGTQHWFLVRYPPA
jgi:hypothetical protein